MTTFTYMRKSLLRVGCAALITGSLPVLTVHVAAQDAPAPKPTADTAAEAVVDVVPPTEITADTLEYDMKNRQAVLTGNVHVVDGEMDLRSNKMIIHFVYSEVEQRDRAQKIDAEGNVIIKRQGVTATGQHATYDVDRGIVVLTGTPVLVQGNSRITGAERVIFNREEERAYTEGGKPKIEFHRSEGKQENAIDIFGADKKATVETDAYTR